MTNKDIIDLINIALYFYKNTELPDGGLFHFNYYHNCLNISFAEDEDEYYDLKMYISEEKDININSIYNGDYNIINFTGSSDIIVLKKKIMKL